MASRMIHLAVINEIIKKRKFDDPERLRTGMLIPDAYEGDNRSVTHFWKYCCGYAKKTYDLTSFRAKYKGLFRKDGLYLGFYLHLILDIVHRRFFAERFGDFDFSSPDQVAVLHADYTSLNPYIVKKYGIVSVPDVRKTDANEKLFSLCRFDLEKFGRELENDLVSKKRRKCRIFKEEDADELIKRGVEACMRELSAVRRYRPLFDEYGAAWYGMPSSLLVSTCNTRDLGGYRTKDGRFTKYGVFLRSDAPKDPAKEDAGRLKDLGVTTVVDLRGQNETEKNPGFAGTEGIDHYCFPIYDGPPADGRKRTLIEAYYAEATHPNVKNIFHVLAYSKGAALFHCSAGKDRTGIIAALILYICGIDLNDIVFDYMVTKDCDKPIFERILDSDPNRDINKIIPVPKTIPGLFDMIETNFGSMEKYFAEVGITKSVRKKIKEKADV